MDVLKSFLVSIKIDGPQREKSKVIFAKDIAEAETKAGETLLRIKRMDWIPVPSDNVDEFGTRYVLAEYKQALLDLDGNPVIFIIKASMFGRVDDQIRSSHASFLQASHVLQGIETLDLEVQE